ncbi:hypothetical protein VNO78_02664 [Psophocarpus tetragonolobus]|uniref:Uncharacterized protein n=1 Tax=Psophocarpus tetragonolobus TaxID=3891 RepID=A0AAN9SZ84_PSOTE
MGFPPNILKFMGVIGVFASLMMTTRTSLGKTIATTTVSSTCAVRTASYTRLNASTSITMMENRTAVKTWSLAKIDVDAFVDVLEEQDGNANECVGANRDDENEVAVDNDVEVKVLAKESDDYEGAKTPQTRSHAPRVTVASPKYAR